MKWSPAKVIEEFARATVRAAISVVTSANRVPHRGSSGPPGGSFAPLMRARRFVVSKPWSVVIQWVTLGQEFWFFVHGTPKQRPRPVETVPEVPPLVAAIRADALRHYGRRADQVA